ncbi:SDR family NAD(P)-dependent oxidoreductase [Tropicibacter naphthalenivorans]|uniref:Putative oxidoreductase n=1 Tax=Tropicibacter naphthalenivorans TaxID=441103 RepID=A0A0P1GEP2_9RHOB|nr:SDR family NAD(P)-dependent oxidoreductase [Tropicibacter naphthalenivorans]CUH79933.1 putative oxidoreductase [Tropicibacter naphthalenivorans]SMC76211.1 Short-chain dehydrogenase [Tropicibacter naphthalenivorans]
MRQLKGKRYWVVGASDGLGAAISQRLSDEGAELVLSARSEGKLQDVADGLSGKAMVLPVDVTDTQALTRAREKIGSLDGLVMLAGVYWPFGAQGWDAEKAVSMAEVNFVGTMKVLGVVLPEFVERDQGHIVLTGSLTAYRGLPRSAPYTASKAGIMALAESLHADLRGSGVDVQLLSPGFVKTQLTDKNDFKMPFIMEPSKAADICVSHMRSARFHKPFPTAFSLMFRAAQFLPDWLYYRLFA